MLKFLRKKGVMKVLLWGIASVVILSFGILSNAYLLNEQPGKLKYAGKVFGRKVSLDDFELNYQFTIIQARLQYGQNFQQIAPSLKLEEQAWERIMLLEQARRQRIKVADNETIETIRQYPFFRNQNTGKFDQKIYQMVLHQGLHITTRAFEEGVRNDLMIKKLFERETFATSISDEEILEGYKQFNEKIRASYVLFPVDDLMKDVSFDEIKAKNYFLEHKRNFLQPEAINVFYLKFPFNDSETSNNQAYDDAFNALTELRSGEELSDVANAGNLKIQDSGFFDIQKPNLTLGWPLETFQELFNMRAGQYTDIITTETSFDILQLRETRPPFFPPYDQVKEEVKSAFLKQETLKLSKTKAEEALPAFDQQGDFTTTAQKQKLEIHQTPDFNFGQYLPDIGPAPAFQRSAFSLTQESPLSGVVETEKGYAIIHLDARIPIDMGKYEKEKDGFGQQFLMRKKMHLFREYIFDLKEKAGIEDIISEHLRK